LTIDQAKSDIGRLFAALGARESKYLQSYNRFYFNGWLGDNIRTFSGTPLGFYRGSQWINSETGMLPAINVGRSIVLTLQSKLIQAKGRIFFNAINGLWRTLRVVREAQTFFDAFTDTDDTYTKIKQAVLDALVFDTGIVHSNPETKRTERVAPWNFAIDQAEYNYGHVTRCAVRYDEYPLIALRDKISPKSPLAAEIANDPTCRKIVVKHWDLDGKKMRVFAGSELAYEIDIEYDKIPFAILFATDPIKGYLSTSVMDNTRQNQRQIDTILQRIHDAIELSPANTVFVPYMAGSKMGQPAADSVAKSMSNKIGNVVPIDAQAGTVVVSTPQPIDGSYRTLLDMFVQASYEQEGVSMLSAQSKKPSGLNSGVALDTIQDIESERFQALVDGLFVFTRQIFLNIIDCFPPDDDILPAGIGRGKLKWDEIQKQRDSYRIQSSLASVLSRDPKTKMEEIEKLQQQNIIDPNMAASLLQIPDIDRAYSVATASYDYCLKIIDDAIEYDVYEFYSVVNLNQLISVVVNYVCQLASEGEDKKIVDRLVKLLNIVMAKINETEAAGAPGEPPPPSPPSMLPQQVAAITKILEDVHAGMIPPASAAALIAAAEPTLPMEQIAQMIGAQTELPGATI